MKGKWLFISILSILLITLLIAADYGISKSNDTKNRGYLGVVVEPLSKKMEKELNIDYGVLIAEIELDSPADKYGLMEEDVILKVNDIKIKRPGTLIRVIRKIKPGEKANIEILRDGKKKNIEVEIGEVKEKDFHFSFSPEKKIIMKIEKKAKLGVRLADLNDGLASYFDAKEGALVLEVEKESAAEKAGIQSGDVIIKVADENVKNSNDVREVISKLEPEDEVKIEVIRHGKKKTLTATLDEMDEDEEVLTLPELEKPNIFMFSPKKLEELNERNLERMLEWHTPGKKIRIEKRIISKPGVI